MERGLILKDSEIFHFEIFLLFLSYFSNFIILDHQGVVISNYSGRFSDFFILRFFLLFLSYFSNFIIFITVSNLECEAVIYTHFSRVCMQLFAGGPLWTASWRAVFFVLCRTIHNHAIIDYTLRGV